MDKEIQQKNHEDIIRPSREKHHHHKMPHLADKRFKLGDKCCSGKRFLGMLTLALGLVLGGFFPGYFYYKTKMDANSVVVKGLAEMNVEADLAIWNMRFVVTGNDVTALQKETDNQIKIVEDFLISEGLQKHEISVGRLETTDLMANPYRNNNVDFRFILTQNINIKSTNVELIATVLNKSGTLVSRGIIFNSDYGTPVTYLFTKLNEIKPQMLALATQNAKQAAQEFADQSGSRVGRIRHANQGVFSILPREETFSAMESTQINKKVRVVSTVEYWLE